MKPNLRDISIQCVDHPDGTFDLHISCPRGTMKKETKKRADRRRERRERLIAIARRMYADGSNDDIEIYDDALVSEGMDGDGAWVQAWVWVPGEKQK